MKSRAQARSSSESDDWGDESWTVDCPCGVNFDDGEEMVDCDECGVWVHTSCCRILKGRTSYVCDKCKNKKRKESEETEIAQVLVELPSKIPPFEEKSLEKPEVCPVPFRSAADLSMEERAHVHGVPGGDARLFLGVSKVFSQQLWKSTGYIPKLLRFSYHELPEWPDEKISPTDFLPEAPKRESDDALLGGLKGDQSTKPEEERNSNADTEHQTDLQSEDRQSLKEKHGKREGRKGDSKHGTHRHKLHNLREERGHHHNRRRREEGGQKESGSRKRLRNTADGAKLNEEIVKKGGVAQEASCSVKATRGSPKNLKAFKKLAAQKYMDGDVKPPNDGKLEPLTAQDPCVHGFGLGDNSGMKIEVSDQDFGKTVDLSGNASTYKLDHGINERGREIGTCTPFPDAPVTLESADDWKVGDEATALRKELDVSETMGQLDILPGKDGPALDVGTDVRIATGDKKEELQIITKPSCATGTSGSNKQVGATIGEQSEEGTEVGKLFEDVDLSTKISIVGKTSTNEIDGRALKQHRSGASITSACSLSKEHHVSRIGSFQTHSFNDSMELSSELVKTFQKQSFPCADHVASGSPNVPIAISGPMTLLKDANSKSGKACLRGVKIEPGFEHFVPDVKPNKSMNSPDSSGSLVQGSSKNLTQSSGHMKDQGILDSPVSQVQGRTASGLINSYQEHSTLLQQQSSSVIPQNALALPLKHSLSEETIHALKQHATVQKLSSPTEAQNPHQYSSKHTEPLRAKPAKSANQRHHMTTDTSHQQSCIDDQPYKESKEDFLHEQINRTDEQLISQDGQAFEEKMQEIAQKNKGQEQKQASPSHSTPFQQGCHQEETLHSRLSANDCPTNVSGKVQTTGEEVPLAAQSISLRSMSNANSSSPTSSSPGVAPKPHLGFLKSSSGSPPSEKSGNVLGITPQPASSSKPNSAPSMVSNSKPPFSLGTNAVTLASTPLKNPSVSKQRTKSIAVPESRKPDIESNVTKPLVSSVPVHHSIEAGSSGVKNSTKELAKLSANASNKSTDLGKPSSLPVLSKQPLHSKGHHVFPSSKQVNHSSCKQELVSQEHVASPQMKQPMKQGLNSTSNKGEKSAMLSGHMASKALPVLPPPHPMGTPERQVLVTASAAPALNDEELALLLHQELNSSPRVPRVARVRHTATTSQLVSSSQVPSSSIKRAAGAALPAVSGTIQKEHHLASRRRVREDSSRESSRGSLVGAEEALKADGCTTRKHEVRVLSCNNKDASDGCSGQKATPLTITEASSPHSPLPVIAEGQSASDLSGANDTTGDRKGSAENILTLPGLIEEILNDKGHQASFDYICEAVFPHWQKLRKQNGERYAYTSHRQAVLDCLRNRAAWAHLIDRGPKTNIGRKRRRHDTALAIESEIDDDADGINSTHDDETDNCKPGKLSKETEVDRNELCPPERVKDDMTLLEEVPKGKRKARHRRRPALQAKGDGGGGLHRKEERRHKVASEASILADSEEEQEPMLSPLSEEAASNYSEEEEEILVHRGSRHARRQGTSVDSGDDEMDL